MLETLEKSDLNQISLTGTRALVILGMLIEAPRTLEEIRNTLISHGLMENEHSDDILRIDLNTLRAMGCSITKASAKTNYTYVLSNHPFTLNISSEEITALKKIYTKAKNSFNLLLMFEYDKLFNKLAGFIGNNEIREELLGISALKNYDLTFLKKLIEDSAKGNILKLTYKNPNSKEETEKEVVVQKIVYKNDKMYLYGFERKTKELVTLNVKRIKKILSRTAGNGEIDAKLTYVKFFITSFGILELDEDSEKIVDEKDNGYVIEGNYHNSFIAMQRILSFGSACTVIEPDDFKQMIIQKLKDMRNIYHD